MTGFKSLKDYVYDYIAEEISQGNLKQNEKVNENKICEKLNISRTPVREALIQLSTEGYLENTPRKGFTIRQLGEKEAQDIYKLLGVLDAYAATQVCGKLDEQDFKDMEFHIGSMNLAIETENFDAYYKQQEEFHNKYIDKSDNDSLINTIKQIKRKFLKKKYVISDNMSITKTLHDTNEEHKIILEYFKDDKADELEKYIRDVHWEPSKAYMETI